MRLTVAAVGRIREGWLAEGVAEYAKRLTRFCTVQVVEVDDAPETLPIERGKAEEGKRLLARVRPGAFAVALDPGGTPCDSVAFAAKLRGWMERGGAETVFLIGGSNGLSDEALARAGERLSLSGMTLTHAFARLMLLEQCYRAFKIAAGERYHK
jgi:23S rRNA (pseudouridine1915-N3)-methyltransferase